MSHLENRINQLWEDTQRTSDSKSNNGYTAIEEVLHLLDAGQLRVVELIDGIWHVHQWIKKAILLSFKLRGHQVTENHGTAYDKVPSKFAGWTADHFTQHNIRVVPGAVVRHGCYIGDNTVIMPSFINIGASVGHNTMIDTWATVGSCAHVGNHCHISGGTGLGGVLEPLQGRPVIIENNCFIGARSEIVEGVIVRQGAVIGMGVFIAANTPIFDQLTGDITYGEVPAYSVVIAGSLASKKSAPNGMTAHLNCAVIIKKVDEQTRRKTAINELLRN